MVEKSCPTANTYFPWWDILCSLPAQPFNKASRKWMCRGWTGNERTIHTVAAVRKSVCPQTSTTGTNSFPICFIICFKMARGYRDGICMIYFISFARNATKDQQDVCMSIHFNSEYCEDPNTPSTPKTPNAANTQHSGYFKHSESYKKWHLKTMWILFGDIWKSWESIWRHLIIFEIHKLAIKIVRSPVGGIWNYSKSIRWHWKELKLH